LKEMLQRIDMSRGDILVEAEVQLGVEVGVRIAALLPAGSIILRERIGIGSPDIRIGRPIAAG
jgi:hypothetical protein